MVKTLISSATGWRVLPSLYNYIKTLPANEALTSDLHVHLVSADTDAILNPIRLKLVEIHLDIVCISKSHVEKHVGKCSRESLKRGLEQGLEQGLEKCANSYYD